MRCMLVGNYGDGNFGDEALKEYMLTKFPSVDWVVISAHPSSNGEVHRLPAGLRSLFATPWWRTISTLRRCDAMVFGGGTLFTDTESVWACVLWWMHAAVARLCGIPRIFCYQGIGPFKKGLGEWCTRSALRGARVVTVRDKVSAARAVALLKSTKVIQTFDPIFSLFEDKKIHTNPQNVLIIIPRANSGESFVDRVRQSLQHSTYASVRVLAFQPDDRREQAVVERLRELAATHAPVSVHEARTIDQTVQVLAGASLVLTHRYHGAIAAWALGVPFQAHAQKPGDKLAEIGAMAADARNLTAVREWIHDGDTAFLAALRELER